MIRRALIAATLAVLALAAQAGVLFAQRGPVRVEAAAPEAITGLDWNGAAASRRMLYFATPPAMYDATYLFKVYPRNQVGTTERYFTTFFWGNHGKFDWTGQYGSAYYGAHPYPTGASGAAPEKWELSGGQGFGIPRDEVVRVDGSSPNIVYDAWYSQAFLAKNLGTGHYAHTFYVDLPTVTDASRIETDRQSAPATPPDGAIIMIGQTSECPTDSTRSWGCQIRWEEANEIIRGLQIYTAALTQAQIAARAACETNQCVLTLNTTDGVSTLWYLNMNPTPSDVTDKSGNGHDPAWEGAGRPTLYTGHLFEPRPAANDEVFEYALAA